MPPSTPRLVASFVVPLLLALAACSFLSTNSTSMTAIPSSSASSNGKPDARKRVLVTGGAGYIGSHVVLELLLTGRYNPIVIDNGHNSKASAAVARIHEIARAELKDEHLPPIDLHQTDLTDPRAVEDVWKAYEGKGGIWGLVHVAAWKAVGESGEKPLKYYQNNVAAFITLMDVASRYSTRNVCFSSSATVYGIPETIPIPETSPLAPESCYGRTKTMSEWILKDLAKADPELKAISLRYFNPAGAHSSGKIGEDPQGKPMNLIPLLAAMAVGRYREPGLKVFGDDYPTVDGTCVRDYLHVVDLAQGHVLALDALDKGDVFPKDAEGAGKYKAYNLGRGQAYSVLQIIAAMRKATGFEYEYEIVGRRDGDVPDLTADPALAQKELGFLAKKGLEEACEDLWRWQGGNPTGPFPPARLAPLSLASDRLTSMVAGYDASK